VDFTLDAIVIPSPYASSFGGFVTLPPAIWFAAGGVITAMLGTVNESRQRKEPRNGIERRRLPADMSATSLVGGGLIAGDSLAALAIGLYGLFKRLILRNNETGHSRLAHGE